VGGGGANRPPSSGGRPAGSGRAPGQRGLAHAARAGDQPAVVQAAPVEGCRGRRLRPAVWPNRRGVSRGCGAPSTRSGSGMSSGAGWPSAQPSRQNGAQPYRRPRHRARARRRSGEAGVGCGKGRKARAHPGLAWQGPYPRTAVRCPCAGAGARQAKGGVDVDEAGQVGFGADHQVVQAVHGGAQIAARDALIDAGAESAKRSVITTSPRASAGRMVFSRWSRRAAVKSRISVSGDQRSGSPSSTRRRISSAPGAAAGFAGQGDACGPGAQGFGQKPGLRGFAGTVDAFEADEKTHARPSAWRGLGARKVALHQHLGRRGQPLGEAPAGHPFRPPGGCGHRAGRGHGRSVRPVAGLR
jgi:hypothetical protein